MNVKVKKVYYWYGAYFDFYTKKRYDFHSDVAYCREGVVLAQVYNDFVIRRMFVDEPYDIDIYNELIRLY